MEKIMSVIPIAPIYWNSSFLVHSINNNIIMESSIDTMDIYTWICKRCDSSQCIHVNAVSNYIQDEIDSKEKI